MATTRLMDGSSLAAAILADTRRRAERVSGTLGRRPCLATVLIGDDPASVTYVRMKQNRCRDTGIESRHISLGETTTVEAVAAVEELSMDGTVDGILVQHPTPAQIGERAVFEAIDPAKDVDGVTFSSFASMALGGSGFESCTPGGIMRLLDHYGVELEGAHAVVIGRSPILGKPVGMLLLARNATVTYCHSRTRELAAHVASTDVVVAAVGIPNFVRGQWLKPGCVVIDAGYNPGTIGDVAAHEAMGVASLLTPVPGGVGPMTIATLLAQTVDAAEKQLTNRRSRAPLLQDDVGADS
jgi:methylenetetrahydrofolate dehydrogenase (NADP+) / methenyltetrahydrofolate cyclohydrolase